MAARSAYRVRVVDEAVVEVGLPSGQSTFPLDLMLKSATLRNILAESDSHEDIVLTFPAGQLESFLKCAVMHHYEAFNVHEIPELLTYLKACDFFADETCLTTLCGVLGRRLFSSTPEHEPQVLAPARKQARIEGQSEVASTSHVYNLFSASNVISTPGQVLESLPEGLALSILKASPIHLTQQLASLPSSLHSLALHAAFPSLTAGDLTLPCTECAISSATKALELFAALPEGHQRHLTVSGVNCMVSPFDHRPVLGKRAHEFRAAFLRCCRSVPELTLALEGQRAYLTPVFQALASSSTLRTLDLTLPSTYSFQSTGAEADFPEDNASSLASSFAFVTSLSSLTISSTCTPEQLKSFLFRPTIVCWDASCFKLLTHLSMESAGFSVCAHHFGTTVARCVELTHLGVHLSLGKCVQEARVHNHAWLSRLTLLTSLTLRCSGKVIAELEDDEEEEIQAELQRRNEVYWYLRLLFQVSLPPLKQLKKLDLAENVLNRSLMQCIVSHLISLEELSTTITVVDENDAHCALKLLRDAVQLRKLCLCVHNHGRLQLGVPCDVLKRLGKYLCCLPTLEHLQLRSNFVSTAQEMARIIKFWHAADHERAWEPASAVVSRFLTHLDFGVVGGFNWDLAEGFSEAGLANLTSLRCLDIWVYNLGSADDFGRVGGKLMPMIAQQTHLETLRLMLHCAPDPEDVHYLIAAQYVAGLAQALKRCKCLSSLKLLGFEIHAEGMEDFRSLLKVVPSLTCMELHLSAVPEFPAVLGEGLANVPQLQSLTLHIGWLHMGGPEQPPAPIENWRNQYYGALAPGFSHLTCLSELHLHRKSDVLRDREKADLGTGVIAIAQALRCSETLHTLTLGGVNVTQRVVRALAAAAPHLKRLSLSATAFPCSAADALTTMLSSTPSLREVSVEMIMKSKQPATEQVSHYQGHLPPAPLPNGSAHVLTTRDRMFVLTVEDPTRCTELRQQCAEAITE